MSEYYTPKIEDIYSGFEYEVFRNNIWKKINEFSNDYDYDDNPHYAIQKDIDAGKIRVKILDIDDIQDFKFVRRKNEWIGYVDYILKEINPEYGYQLHATIHVPKMNNYYKIYVHRYLAEDSKIEEQIKEGESKCVFEGIIKNKSKLRELLTEQLEIING